MRLLIIAFVVCLIAMPLSFAGQDFVSSWGNNNPLIDQYAKHALCVESKSYYVNTSDPRTQTCPKNTCRFERWRATNYVDPKYSNNVKYALRRVTNNQVKNYLYLPTTNVESINKPDASKTDVVHPRKVVVSILNADFGNQLYQASFGQLVAEQHEAAFYVDFLAPDSPYSTGKQVLIEKGGKITPEQEGFAAIRKYLDPIFLWELLPEKHPDKQTCARGNVTFTKRIYDLKHPRRTSELFNTDLLDFVHPEQNKHSCLVVLGFFKNIYPCAATIKTMWDAIDRDIELASSVKSYARDTSSQKRDKRHRNFYTQYKYMAAHQGDFVSLHRPAPIALKRAKRKPSPPPAQGQGQHLTSRDSKQGQSLFETAPAPGHIISDTSYERDNNPDLLLKRMRHKQRLRKQGKTQGALFLDGREI